MGDQVKVAAMWPEPEIIDHTSGSALTVIPSKFYCMIPQVVSRILSRFVSWVVQSQIIRPSLLAGSSSNCRNYYFPPNDFTRNAIYAQGPHSIYH